MKACRYSICNMLGSRERRTIKCANSNPERRLSIILELVGKLATYRPGAKVAFFDGEDSFDLHMVSHAYSRRSRMKSTSFQRGNASG